MPDRQLLHTGSKGTVTAAVCCLRPGFVLLLAAVGLSAWMGWGLDYLVLVPALAFFLGLTGYAVYRVKRKPAAQDDPGADAAEIKEAS